MGEIASMLILWVVVIGLMWFLLMRPQKKEQKRVQAMLIHGSWRYSTDNKRILRCYYRYHR